MSKMIFRFPISRIPLFLLCLSLTGTLLMGSNASHALVPIPDKSAEEPKQAEVVEPAKSKPAGPVDEHNRGVPKTMINNFIDHTGKGDFERAANYLDLRNLPRWMDSPDGKELAHQLKIVIDRAMWIDFDSISADSKGHSEDGLPSYRDSLGRIETPDRTVDILIQHVPREDGIYIWKFSNRTVAEIPYLWDHFGYSRLEERLSEMFPDVIILGWQLWQWIMFLGYVVLAYAVALLVTFFLNRLWQRKESELSQEITSFFHGPLRFVLWIIGISWAGHSIGLSTSIRFVARANTAFIIVFTWAIVRTVDIAFAWWTDRLLKGGSQAATVLLRPVRTFARMVIVAIGVLVWLDNIGFDITTLLAGLGVGGFAVALAAQDTLKNFIGSILILLDKPYVIGERIQVKGHDGVVEEIGLRSTRIRELNGHQTVIPNDEMARLDIENVGRRPSIRRSTTISIAYDTPLEKVEKAVDIIKGILENHEGMNPDSPPRVFFREFSPTSLAIMMLYWYEPPMYWDFMAFNERVNVQIMEEFGKEGIELALPITEARLTMGDEKPLEDILAGEADQEA